MSVVILATDNVSRHRQGKTTADISHKYGTACQLSDYIDAIPMSVACGHGLTKLSNKITSKCQPTITAYVEQKNNVLNLQTDLITSSDAQYLRNVRQHFAHILQFLDATVSVFALHTTQRQTTLRAHSPVPRRNSLGLCPTHHTVSDNTSRTF